MTQSQLDLLVFTLGNMVAVITLSVCLLTLGWIGFLAIWLTIHSGVCLWCAWKLFFAKSQISETHS